METYNSRTGFDLIEVRGFVSLSVVISEPRVLPDVYWVLCRCLLSEMAEELRPQLVFLCLRSKPTERS